MSMEKCYIFRKLINFVKDAELYISPMGDMTIGFI